MILFTRSSIRANTVEITTLILRENIVEKVVLHSSDRLSKKLHRLSTYSFTFLLNCFRFNAIISCEWGHPRQFQSGLLHGDLNENGEKERQKAILNKKILKKNLKTRNPYQKSIQNDAIEKNDFKIFNQKS